MLEGSALSPGDKGQILSMAFEVLHGSPLPLPNYVVLLHFLFLNLLSQLGMLFPPACSMKPPFGLIPSEWPPSGTPEPLSEPPGLQVACGG